MNQTNNSTSIDTRRAYDVLHAQLTQGGAASLAPERVEDAFTVSTEAYAPGSKDALESRFTDYSSAVESIGSDAFDFSTLTPAQQDAFRYSAMALDDLAGYHDMATKVSLESKTILPVGGEFYLDPAFSADALRPGTEAYDGRDLINSKIATVIVNVACARQDDFAEAFFPTVVLPPNQGNIRLEIENSYIMPDYLHTGTGDGGVPEGFGGTSIIDAIIHPSVLRDESTRIIPVYSASNPVFSQEINAWRFPGSATETGALKFNRPIDLLAVSNDALLNTSQVMDSTDQLDHDVRIHSLFLKLKHGSDTEYFRIEVRDMPGAVFFPAMASGASRDMSLGFNNSAIPLHGNMKTIAGQESKVLEYLRQSPREDWVVYLDINVSGKVNLEQGSIRVNEGKVLLDSVWKAPIDSKGLTDHVQITKSTDINALEQHFEEIELVGWWPEARRSNTNRRTRGILVRMDRHHETYQIPMGPPVSALTPTIPEAQPFIDLESPIKVNRIMNSQNALRTLLNYGDSLAKYHNAVDIRSPRPPVRGIATHVIRPYYAHKKVDMAKLVDSLQSSDHLENVNWAIFNVIREMVTKCWTYSNYGPAWQALGMSGVPIVNIGCNSEIASYLFLKGDNRTLGELFKPNVVATNNTEIGDDIIINFTTTSDNKLFQSGNFYYIPEVVSTLPKTQNGAQSVQLTVQNRNIHICHTPIQMRLTLVNLDKVLISKIPVKTLTTVDEIQETVKTKAQP